MGRSGYFSFDSLKGVHTLIVDDETLAREVLRDTLEYCGALVLTVESARAALETMRLLKPDVLVTKLALPGADGFSLLRQVRDLKPEGGGKVPIVAIGGHASDREECLAHGFQGYFAWPLNPWEFSRTIAALIATD